MQMSGQFQSLGTLHGTCLQLLHLTFTCMIGVLSQCSKSKIPLFVGVPPNIARRCGAAVDIRDGCGGNVETRVEQNWEIPAACCELDFDALCSTLRMYDPAPLITFVQSLKHFLHKIPCLIHIP
ncbi:hypothetical protein AMECASPLE_038325 [Ameca splendens]|uniref:Uncharacterized protein n=1 Tax=Ameca splendens TaxID=208324 RepID=A0ABV0Y8B9_9TELE